MATTMKKTTARKSVTSRSRKVTKPIAVKKKTAAVRPSSKKKVVQTKKSAIRKTAVRQASRSTAARKSAPKTGKAIMVVKAEAKTIMPRQKPARAIMPVKAEKPGNKNIAYEPQKIEQKWQERWKKDGLYRSVRQPGKPKHYALTMLPYPSGDLHIGHWYAMTPADARARYKRMLGYNVLFPMGFDAFGLPAENAAIKDGIHPMKRTFQNIEHMRRQLSSMGAMFDWEREMVSADPEFYKWTEWFFIQLYKMGLAYRKLAPVDWCPKDNTTLAREQVIGDERVCVNAAARRSSSGIWNSGFSRPPSMRMSC